ncbi:MAG TPA: hypothetical protein PKJ52_01060 [Rectinema sp.]|nr:hypothetical protein [Rectinema sp.]
MEKFICELLAIDNNITIQQAYAFWISTREANRDEWCKEQEAVLFKVACNSVEVREAAQLNKTQAIKELRRLTDCGLMTAKKIIERIYFN